jgi:choline dehydrogenase-like flavoprotein
VVRKIVADVVVAGSGAGGSAVAGELAAAGLRVVVVEAGQQRFTPLGVHVRTVHSSEADLSRVGDIIYGEMLTPPSMEAEPLPGIRDLRVSHHVGGMFALWMGNCPHPDASELPDWLPPSDWEPYFARAAKLMHIDLQGGGSGEMFQTLLARVEATLGSRPAGRHVRPMPVAARRVDGVFRICASDALFFRDQPPPNGLTILPDTIATEVLLDGEQAIGLRAVSRTDRSETIEVSAGVVVLSGGTVGSPKILANSPLDHRPALGAYIHEHACIGSRITLLPDIRRLIRDDEPVYSIWIPASGEKPWQNQLCRFTLSSGGSRLAPGIREVDSSDIFTFVKIDVRPENRLNFDPVRKDPFGLPAVTATYGLSRQDRERIGQAMAEHFLIASDVGEIEPGWTPSLYAAGGSTHFMGSCRMGAADDGTSVVDRFGAVWGYRGLYVADNSVIGTPNSGNPTFTTVAQCLRTADRILATT